LMEEAIRHGVSESLISYVRSGKIWKRA
jgi:hypothetical protein